VTLTAAGPWPLYGRKRWYESVAHAACREWALACCCWPCRILDALRALCRLFGWRLPT
jgi:hypothetical protein